MLKKGVAKQVQPQILSLSEGSKVLAHVNADHPITAKPSEVRMGKGKGVIKDWVAKVRQGTIIFQTFLIAFKSEEWLSGLR
eukprot:4199171-Lingulodinium_polyedra.AAC.1